MKIVLQRVKKAAVKIRNQSYAQINQGICLFVGIEKGDTEENAFHWAMKVSDLRIFSDSEGKMNRSLLDVQGEVLAVSQFTLAGSVKKGRRPSFDHAEEPEKAESLFDYFVECLKKREISVKTGKFGALMEVILVNDGPVTFIISEKAKTCE